MRFYEIRKLKNNIILSSRIKILPGRDNLSPYNFSIISERQYLIFLFWLGFDVGYLEHETSKKGLRISSKSLSLFW